jgi:hypothetical protein
MPDRYLLESSPTDGYLLEDGSGVFLLEQEAGEDQRLLRLSKTDGMGRGGVFPGNSLE